jgi:hypothetical protein
MGAALGAVGSLGGSPRARARVAAGARSERLSERPSAAERFRFRRPNRGRDSHDSPARRRCIRAGSDCPDGAKRRILRRWSRRAGLLRRAPALATSFSFTAGGGLSPSSFSPNGDTQTSDRRDDHPTGYESATDKNVVVGAGQNGPVTLTDLRKFRIKRSAATFANATLIRSRSSSSPASARRPSTARPAYWSVAERRPSRSRSATRNRTSSGT